MSSVRLTKARLKLAIDSAIESGGRILRIDAAAGTVDVIVGAAANDAHEDPDEVEAKRLQELMNTAREPAKR